MKKSQWLSALLSVGVGFAGSHVAMSAVKSAEEKPTQEKTSTSKKHRSTHKAYAVTPSRRMTERDIVECTALINKVAQTDKIIQQDMAARAASTSKIAEQLKKPTQSQIFASDNPAAIAHLTGKASAPLTATVAPTQPVIKPSTNPPVTTKSNNIPHGSQLFASNNPKDIALLTGKEKVAVPESRTKEPYAKVIVAPQAALPPVPQPKPKEATSKLTTPTAHHHPHIELFAPNTVDLNHLQGRSASLALLQKSSNVESSHKKVSHPHKTKTKTKKTNAAQTTTPPKQEKPITTTPVIENKIHPIEEKPIATDKKS